ncbi:glycosyltransferase [Mesorhizobium sp. LNHC209A00]|uniref:glycosyltransferase n=1 Tax=Mesorhizobium TaxID=68287 RepID=UPI0018DDEA80|nr:glycosyltransferase [Mesorhizobium sp. LNHC209A00]
MNNPPITVIIPTYNHERYIEESVRSVRSQSIILSCNVIISDDCSTDNTVDKAIKASEGAPNITIRRNIKNAGVMEHYKLLSKLVDTPYLAILEGDDYWSSTDKLELQKSLLDAHPGVGLCFSACLVDDEASGTSWHHPGWPVDRHRVVQLLDLLTSNPIATFSNCFYRTQRFVEVVDRANVKSGYDWLLNMTIAASGGALFAARTSTVYRLHANGTWTRLGSEQKRAEIIKSLASLKDNVDVSFDAFIDAAMTRALNDR